MTIQNTCFEIKNIKKSREVKETLSDLVERERVSKRVSAREYMHESHDDFDGDHDFDGDLDKRRSLIEFVFYISGCAMSWKVKVP